jgi:hypothetical protein
MLCFVFTDNLKQTVQSVSSRYMWWTWKLMLTSLKTLLHIVLALQSRTICMFSFPPLWLTEIFYFIYSYLFLLTFYYLTACAPIFLNSLWSKGRFHEIKETLFGDYSLLPSADRKNEWDKPNDITYSCV